MLYYFKCKLSLLNLPPSLPQQPPSQTDTAALRNWIARLHSPSVVIGEHAGSLGDGPGNRSRLSSACGSSWSVWLPFRKVVLCSSKSGEGAGRTEGSERDICSLADERRCLFPADPVKSQKTTGGFVVWGERLLQKRNSCIKVNSQGWEFTNTSPCHCRGVRNRSELRVKIV